MTNATFNTDLLRRPGLKHILLLAACMATGFLSAQSITGYRYWLNDDPSTLTAANIGPGAAVDLNTALGLPALNKDFNTITLQFMDGNGDYSVPRTSLFSKNTGLVTGYAYWIDDAISSATSGTIGPDATANLIADLPTGNTGGTHQFTIRFSSANGTWSIPFTAEFSFYSAIDELPGISDLLLFPNPVAEQVGLRLNTTEARALDVQLLDIQGRLVRHLSPWTVQGSGYRNWDISDLASGTYHLRLSDRNGSRDLPFVKM